MIDCERRERYACMPCLHGCVTAKNVKNSLLAMRSDVGGEQASTCHIQDTQKSPILHHAVTADLYKQ